MTDAEKESRLDPRLVRGALFLLVFGLASAAHFVFRPVISPVLNDVINAHGAAAIINVLMPDANVTAADGVVGGQGAYVRIAIGCEGLDVMLMIAAALLVTPMAPRRKALGVLYGVSLMFSLNLVRIAALWYCARDYPSYFEAAHVTVGQTVMIVVGASFYGLWTGAFKMQRPPVVADGAA